MSEPVLVDPVIPAASFEVAGVAEYAQFVEAAKLLRDAEVAVAKARDYYRASLDALNRAVAPLPSE